MPVTVETGYGTVYRNVATLVPKKYTLIKLSSRPIVILFTKILQTSEILVRHREDR
jgi:hypothetical protein